MSDAMRMRTPPLPSGSIGARASGWWAMIFLVLTEASVFAYLFFAYFYYAVHSDYRPWPPYGPPSLTFAIPETALIIFGAVAMWVANRRASVAVRPLVAVVLLLVFLFGVGFIVLGLLDWASKPFTLASTAYSSIYFVLTGTHLVHVAIGVLMAASVSVWCAVGYLGPVRHVPITVTALYWYFLAVSWAALFFVVYITPYLGNG